MKGSLFSQEQVYFLIFVINASVVIQKQAAVVREHFLRFPAIMTQRAAEQL